MISDKVKTLDDHIEYQTNMICKNKFMQKHNFVHAHTLHLNFYLRLKEENERQSTLET